MHLNIFKSFPNLIELYELQVFIDLIKNITDIIEQPCINSQQNYNYYTSANNCIWLVKPQILKDICNDYIKKILHILII